MAVAKTTKTAKSEPVKMTPAQMKKRITELEEKLEKFQSYGYCYLCDTHKSKDKFYVSTDPLNKSGITPICKECARKLALRVDKNGDEHEPTKDSVIKALEYLNKPYLNTVWDASVQESENLIAGKTKSNVWTSYAKNIAMVNYLGMTYKDSDMFKEKVIYDDEIVKKTPEDLKNTDIGTYDQYIKDKSDVIRLLHYDPFEKEAVEDQPFLYSQLLGLLDSSEDANDDMMRVSSCITIVRNFLQLSKIDNAIAEILTNAKNIEMQNTVIKGLQDSKQKISSVITNLAAESCISLKNNKNAKKGENTWTGKIKKIKDLNLREGEVNGFDLGTCKGMKQVMDMSNASILKQLRLDESEYSDMIADQREMIVKYQEDLENYKEISRILLRENLDLKDYLKENNMLNPENLVDLNELYSCFSETNEDDINENIEVVENDNSREIA